MQACESILCSQQERSKVNYSSDGSTPQKQTEQILAVTPIIPGQNFQEKHPIPPPRNRTASYNSINAPEVQQPSQPAPAAQHDLIDFGQDDRSTGIPPAPPSGPADLYAAQTQNGGQRQKDLEEKLKSTSTTSVNNTDSLIDFHQDLKKDLPNAALLRQDTDTNSVDEFVDAQG